MQPTASYATSDAFIRLLLQGAPGQGKTTLACQFPNAYVADCDLNLGGPLRFLRDHNLTQPVGYDTIDRKEDGTVVQPNMRYQRLAEVLSAAAADASVSTIVIDSATKLDQYIKDHVLRTNPTKTGAMEMVSWGFYLAFWKDLVAKITAQRKHFVLIAHEKVEKDEVDGALKYFLNIPGQFGNMAGALFTDVWRAEVASTGGLAASYKWQIRTMPDYRFQLKNSFGLPALFEFDWKLIEAKLKGEVSK